MSTNITDVLVKKVAYQPPSKQSKRLSDVNVQKEKVESPLALIKNNADMSKVQGGLSVKEEVKEKKIEQTIAKLENTKNFLNTKISYEIDKSTEQLVIKIIDKESKEVIRQIPPEELLNLAEKLEKTSSGDMKGIIINDKG